MKLRDKDYYPKAMKDMEYSLLFSGKQGNTYCMGSKCCDKYIQLNEKNKDAVQKAVQLMDGHHAISKIQQHMEEEYQMKIDILQLCEWLGKAGLLENRPEDVNIEKQEMDYLSLKIKGWRLEKWYKLFSFLGEKHGKEILISSVVLILTGIALMVIKWKDFFQLKSYEVHGSLLMGVMWVLLLFVLSIGIHELSHAVVGYRCGLKPKELVFSLYLGSPMFYIKMPGIYTIAPKKRIFVWAAGVYANLMVAAICAILMQCTQGSWRNMFLICCSTNISLVVANLSPLLPLDGYFILSTLLKRPNLRKGSFQQFKKWFLRKENNFSGWYVLYFVISVAFYVVFALYEVEWLVNVIKKGITYGYTWKEYLYEFRIIVMILGIILIKKCMELIVNMTKRRLVRV